MSVPFWNQMRRNTDNCCFAPFRYRRYFLKAQMQNSFIWCSVSPRMKIERNWTIQTERNWTETETLRNIATHLNETDDREEMLWMTPCLWGKWKHHGSELLILARVTGDMPRPDLSSSKTHLPYACHFDNFSFMNIGHSCWESVTIEPDIAKVRIHTNWHTFNRIASSLYQTVQFRKINPSFCNVNVLVWPFASKLSSRW